MVASVRGRRKKWSESSGVKTTLQCGQNISVHRKNMKNLAGTPPANKKESQTIETERERENNLHQIKGYKRPVQTPRWGWKRSWELEEVYEGFPRTSPRKCPPRQTCEIVKWKQNKALRYIFTYIHIHTPQYHTYIYRLLHKHWILWRHTLKSPSKRIKKYDCFAIIMYPYPFYHFMFTA